MMKSYELNEQEMNGVAGGSSYIDHYIHVQQMDRENGIATGSDEASTAWEVIKYAFDVCG